MMKEIIGGQCAHVKPPLPLVGETPVPARCALLIFAPETGAKPSVFVPSPTGGLAYAHISSIQRGDQVLAEGTIC
jgi:hypothetical protein